MPSEACARHAARPLFFVFDCFTRKHGHACGPQLLPDGICLVLSATRTRSQADRQEQHLLLMSAVSTMSARDMVERYRAAANDEITGGYARELLGSILGVAIPGSRRALQEKLVEEASEACARARARARNVARSLTRPLPARSCLVFTTTSPARHRPMA